MDGVGGGMDPAELFSRLVAKTASYVGVIDRQRRLLFLNHTVARALDEVLGRPIEVLLVDEDRPRAIDAIERAFARGETCEFEYRAVLAGDPRWFTAEVIPAGNAGDGARALVLSRDITSARETELALRASEARFRALADHSPDVFVVVDEQRRVGFHNYPCTKPPGHEVAGMLVFDLIRPEDRPAAATAIARVLDDGQPAEYEATGLADGARYRVRVRPFPANDGPRALLIATDITAARRDEALRDSLREQLQQAQRMESLGLLAGGVAHDFNNLLQVILANLHFVRGKLGRGQDPEDDLASVESAAERAAELTGQLLAIGRRQTVRARPVDLDTVVTRVVGLLRRTVPASIFIDQRQPGAPCVAKIDPPKIEQMLLNLCLNARDAMPDGGTLTIAAQAVDADTVSVTVRDTGHGMDETTRARIFEPFFTTKQHGQGSGLGLAVAEGIVQSHGGTIEVASEPGRGTQFTVRLPRVAATAEDEPPEASLPDSGEACILVVEDDAMVRTQVVRILRNAGYGVLEAGDGVEAVERYEERADVISLVLMDVVMPRQNGWQAYEAIAAQHPDVRVLFMSGYSAGALPDLVDRPALRVIGKPFAPRALLAAIAAALEPGSPEATR